MITTPVSMTAQNFAYVVDSELYTVAEKRHAAAAYAEDVIARLTQGRMVNTSEIVLLARAYGVLTTLSDNVQVVPVHIYRVAGNGIGHTSVLS